VPIFADTNLRILRYSAETVYAETPAAPAMTEMRTTGDTFVYNKRQEPSKEIRRDRMIPSVVQLGVTVEGAANIELSLKTYDTFFEACLGGTWGATAANQLRNGIVKRSFLFEKEFQDIGTSFIQYLGMRCVELMMNFRAQNFVDGTFTFWGNKALSAGATVASASGAPTDTPSLSASADVGTLTYKGVALTSAIKDVQVTVNNMPRHRPVVGSKFDADIGEGQFQIRLAGTALVDNLNLFADVIAHNTVSLVLPVTDELGNSLTITLPALKISGNPDTPASNQDVDFKFTAEAFRDPTTDCMIQLDRVEV
jgi:Phage tail tube protein